jgi:hypothetical protein
MRPIFQVCFCTVYNALRWESKNLRPILRRESPRHPVGLVLQLSPKNYVICAACRGVARVATNFVVAVNQSFFVLSQPSDLLQLCLVNKTKS